MATKQKKKLNWRAFTSMLILFSFLIIAVSGIILYIAPPGRIAHWSDWTLFALTKEGWQAVHTIFSFTFVIAAVFHLNFNWKPLMAYLKRKIEAGTRVRKELTYAGLVTAGVLSLTIAGFPPFSNVMNIGESLTNSWASENNTPPVPHAELKTLPEFCDLLNVGLKESLNKLKAASIAVNDSAATVSEIAERNGTTPSAIYELLKPQQHSEVALSGSGYGMKNVTQLSAELGQPLTDVLSKLAANGIEATAESTLKELAAQYQVKPFDLVEMVRAHE